MTTRRRDSRGRFVASNAPITRGEVLGDKQLRDELENIAEAMHGRKMVRTIRRASALVLRDAKKFAPVDTGRLRSSMTISVAPVGFPRRVVGVVGTPVHYAPHMEYGTDHNKMPPVSALEGWARRHGVNAFAVAQGILMRGGLQGHFFMKRAAEKNEKAIIAMLGNHVRLAINEG